MTSRKIVITVETTGLDANEGHRIVEITALELVARELTGRKFNQIIDPERPIPASATDVHGIGDFSIGGEPTFAAAADGLLEFLGDAPLIAFNAPFHIEFLNAELERLGEKPIAYGRMIDVRDLYGVRYPGLPRGLEAMCDGLRIDPRVRSEPTALGDTMLVAEVYRCLSED